ncbi:MAG TPA: DoxX family protein [Solirubrobacteraceae bacterium]|jgi:putative oxidoreductase|nr:DoxX family protein [Solirubrobacteraceae bacterium]
MKIGRLLLRAAVGGFFVGHGTQKLFGWFGGNGLKGTTEGFEQLGLRPAKVHATAAGIAEAGGGALMVAGLETPLAAAALTATMITAIQKVHLKNGPWTANGGYEYNLVLIAAALAIAEVGPGPLSLDAARGKEREGSGWALAALAAGIAGAAGAHLLNGTSSAPEPAQSSPEAPDSLQDEVAQAASDSAEEATAPSAGAPASPAAVSPGS